MIYFWYSLIFLIIRTFAVSLLAAAINDESQKPIEVLRKVPSHLWNVETKRFFSDIMCKSIALSGMNFFFLTRKLILSVAGTVITYELVKYSINTIESMNSKNIGRSKIWMSFFVFWRF